MNETFPERGGVENPPVNHVAVIAQLSIKIDYIPWNVGTVCAHVFSTHMGKEVFSFDSSMSCKTCMFCVT